MKWMLVIVVITFADQVSHRSVAFEDEAACVAAGEAFVERFPQFRWHAPSGQGSIETPVLRPHVRCLPADEDNTVGPA